MPIFYRDNYFILYIHVPKTGGRFILDAFQKNHFEVAFLDTSNIVTGFNKIRTCSPQHYHAELLRQTLRLEKLNYVFMTVRNPLDRLKSEFLWRVREVNADPNAWAKHVITKFQSDHFILDNHIRPQGEFFLNGADIFKTEDQFDEKWLNALNARTGLGLSTLPELKSNSSKDITGRTIETVQFTPEINDFVTRFYAEDYERFGYVAT